MDKEVKEQIKNKLIALKQDMDQFEDPNWYGDDDCYEASRENIDDIAELLEIKLDQVLEKLSMHGKVEYTKNKRS